MTWSRSRSNTRADYGAIANTIHMEARACLIQDANLPPRDIFYRESPGAAEAHHVALPTSSAPGSDHSRSAMLVPSLIVPRGGPNALTLKYPVPPSLTAVPLGPVSFMPAIGIILQYGGNTTATDKPRLFNPGTSISEVRMQANLVAAATQAPQALPSQFTAAAAAAAHALNAGGPPNQRWTLYNYQATPGQVGIPPPPVVTAATPNDPGKWHPQVNKGNPTGSGHPGGYGAPALEVKEAMGDLAA
ncbi:hypothetical protein K438DRAFT_1980377 [Mycena galopus ATCC 62051]|nr:hypothetical protein K438DRAFT_1980377 [Mycena galopus ATCC 62051]